LVKKASTFVGHDDGISQTYCIRLPGEEQAQQLKEALDQEINSAATATAKDGETINRLVQLKATLLSRVVRAPRFAIFLSSI
jgi:hypothetical protein